MSPAQFQIEPVSENSLMVYCNITELADSNQLIQQLNEAISVHLASNILELIPAYRSVLIYFHRITHQQLTAQIEQLIQTITSGQTQQLSPAQHHHIPVCYHSDFGLDLHSVAAYHGLTPKQVVTLHSEISYRVYAIGFAPGFAYLGEVNPVIATPRHASPRQAVPAGSVAIADQQTAIYPNTSPGGWQVLGRTPKVMFNMTNTPPCPLRVGDTVSFSPISLAEFNQQVKNNAC